MNQAVRQAVAWCVLILLVAGVASSCQRKPRFVPTEDDTSAAPDSGTLKLRTLIDLWDAGVYEDAAATTAEILAADLSHRAPDVRRGRASQFLDSLSIGAEIAGGSCAMTVNFFARSDPGAGSWPYLFWCDGNGVSQQKVQGSGLSLGNMVSRGFEGQPAAGGSGPGVAALFSRRGRGGQLPILMVWALRGTSWRLQQTLGADSLGGVGTGEFEIGDDSITLTTRTFRAAPYFEECASCPHAYTVRRFRWEGSGFERTGEEKVPSMYATFVDFIRAMMASDWNQASTRVTHRSLLDAANRFDWGRPMGSWRVAPVNDGGRDELVMYRGQDEAYRVHFEPWGRDWLISGFEPVPRSID